MSVYKRKNKKGSSWMVDFEYVDPITGRKRRFRRIAKGAKTKAQALAMEREWREEAETAPVLAEQPKDGLFKDFAGHWKDKRRADWKPSAYRGYEQILRVHLVPWFKVRTMRSITPEDIQDYKIAKLGSDEKPGLSPKTVNNHLGVLSSLFEDAVKWRYAAFNPCRAVKPCRVDKSLESFAYWTQEESERFLTAVGAVRPRWQAFFLTALRTGLRLGELAALRWSDIDLEWRRIHVRRSWTRGHETLPKGGKPRTLSFGPRLRLVLLEHKLRAGKQARVFLSDEGKMLDSNRVKHHFWAGIKAAGVKRIRIHDLRHSFASQLVIKGVSIYKVQKLLGHKDVKTTMRYAHLSPEAQEDAVLLLDEPPAARPRHVSGSNDGGAS